MDPKHFKETINGHTFQMNYIHGGTFDMGDEHGDLGKACGPVQKGINIKPFYLAEYPVTQALWNAVSKKDNPSYFKGENRPVEIVSWDEAKAFLKDLNNTQAARERREMDGLQYRLPSEVQWEYAAREGKNDPKLLYAGGVNLKEVGWYDKNSHQETNPVGLKLPNEWGLYDMSGNIYEWCEDDWVDTLKGMPKDGSPRKIKDEKKRVVRGGSWYVNDDDGRVADRGWIDSDIRSGYIGFRLARY